MYHQTVGLWDPDLPHSLLLSAHAASGFALSHAPIKFHLATNSKTVRDCSGASPAGHRLLTQQLKEHFSPQAHAVSGFPVDQEQVQLDPQPGPVVYKRLP